MSNYHHFIGIDIGKKEVVVGTHGSKATQSFPNSAAGFKLFFKEHRKTLSDALVVLETTGGYEQLFLNALMDKNVAVHRADTRKVKSFIRSWGKHGKSDALDAQALSLYGYERHKTLDLFQPPEPIALKLAAFAQRRQDLNQMLVQEKNRLKSPQNNPLVLQSYQDVIQALNNQISAITQEIEAIIKNNPHFQAKQEVLQEIPGIGSIISATLLAQLPELGQLNRKQIAALCGLAPYPCESGQTIGYRRTKGGRQQVRSLLFMAAMSARRSNSPLKAFYEKLIAKGKKKMVALTALMRKIIVIANAKLKELALQSQSV
jgi:transposase